jgi:hypothetical protein
VFNVGLLFDAAGKVHLAAPDGVALRRPGDRCSAEKGVGR